ncbi:MAG: hypothetical protein ABIV48_02350 [Pyrinomonadaceae bacterium]
MKQDRQVTQDDLLVAQPFYSVRTILWKTHLIYGAYGYTGELITRFAVEGSFLPSASHLSLAFYGVGRLSHGALHIAEKILAGNFIAGYQTPAKAYGADIILEIEGAARQDT